MTEIPKDIPSYAESLKEISAALPQRFYPLRPIFEQQDMINLMEAANSFDARAKKSAEKYKRFAYTAIWSVLGSAVFAGLATMTGGTAALVEADWSSGQRVLTSFQFLFLAVAIGMLAVLYLKKMRREWIQTREQAEITRQSQFNRFLETNLLEEPDTAETLKKKYDFLRWALLYPQMDYFKDRSADAAAVEAGKNRHRLWIILGVIAAVFTALFSGILILLSLFVDLPDLLKQILSAPQLLFVEAVAGAIGAFALGWIAFRGTQSSLFDHQKAATRIAQTQRELVDLEGLESGRNERLLLAIAQNDKDAVAGWLEVLSGVLRNDRSSWVSEMDINEAGGSDIGALLDLIVNRSSADEGANKSN